MAIAYHAVISKECFIVSVFSHQNRTLCWRCISCRWQVASIEASKIYPSWV